MPSLLVLQCIEEFISKKRNMNLPIKTLTDLLHSQLTKFPFHNLSLLNGTTAHIGGTCFDHALELKKSLEAEGFVARLHEAEVCMTGEVTHRLVNVIIGNQNIFLDTGSGWPTRFIIEQNLNESNHEIAGVNFQVTSQEKHILVRRHNGTRWLDMNRIYVAKQDEESILDKFNGRYKQTLPFSDELRLSWLEGQKFFRLSNDKLFVFESGKAVNQIKLAPVEILRRIEKTTFPGLIADLSKYLEENT
jgi:arylamine N-acetyltransferase